MERLRPMLDYVRRHERRVAMLSLVAGFVWDYLTLGRPDSFYNNFIFTTYLVVTAAAIILIAVYEKRRRAAPALILPLMQFCFGTLAGQMVVVYGRSGPLTGSALFLTILLSFIIGNELLRTYYARLSFHVAAWYFLLFAYLAIVVPIIVGRVGTLVFLLSGGASILFVIGFLLVLRSISRERVVVARRQNIALIGGIFALFNVLYFTNVLPPVPMSLSGIGVYHSIERLADGTYQGTYEAPAWWELFRDTSGTFTELPSSPRQGSAAYCFSSVFAPVRLGTVITHVWESYDPSAGRWIERSAISFPIAGGALDGYRGYSVKQGLEPGEWRCSVKNVTGALVGRIGFSIVAGTPALSTRQL